MKQKLKKIFHKCCKLFWLVVTKHNANFPGHVKKKRCICSKINEIFTKKLT